MENCLGGGVRPSEKILIHADCKTGLPLDRRNDQLILPLFARSLEALERRIDDLRSITGL